MNYLDLSLTVNDHPIRTSTPDEILKLFRELSSKRNFSITIRQPKDFVVLKDSESFLTQGSLLLQRQSLHENVWQESQIFLKEKVLYYYKNRFHFEIEKERQQFSLEGCRVVAIEDEVFPSAVGLKQDEQDQDIKYSMLEVLAAVKQENPSVVHTVDGKEWNRYAFKVINLFRGEHLVLAAHSEAERDFWMKELSKRAIVTSTEELGTPSNDDQEVAHRVIKGHGTTQVIGCIDADDERHHILERIKVLKLSVLPRHQKILQGIEEQVRNRSDLDATMEIGLTPVGGCCYFNDARLLGMLLDMSADLNVKDIVCLHESFLPADCSWQNGMAPLSIACEEGESECVELLLERRADIKGNSEARGVEVFPARLMQS